eukprot:GHUV01028634.1.p1 GENE.GHUV01028634.1~~GHUV01028634.1.p1  ORF type:complete len:142 (+),score=12.58 GHUV01028634.1:1015-1440(+)
MRNAYSKNTVETLRPATSGVSHLAHIHTHCSKTLTVVMRTAPPAAPVVTMTARRGMIVTTLVCNEYLVVIFSALFNVLAYTAVGVCAFVVAARVGVALDLLLTIPFDSTTRHRAALSLCIFACGVLQLDVVTEMCGFNSLQ